MVEEQVPEKKSGKMLEDAYQEMPSNGGEKKAIKSDSSESSFQKFNFIFYFLYKYKYENNSQFEEEDLTLFDVK